MSVADEPGHHAKAPALAVRQRSIPHISHGKQHPAACDGIWLHGPQASQGRRSVPELVFVVVAGPGFEPG
jgi:hypothetical protein